MAFLQAIFWVPYNIISYYLAITYKVARTKNPIVTLEIHKIEKEIRYIFIFYNSTYLHSKL